MIGWAYWTLYQVVSLVLTVVGWVLLAPLSALHLWVFRAGSSSMFPGRMVWAWRGGWLTWLWSNDEDGICGGALPTPLAAYKWSALRNSVNNMRFLPGASFLTVKAQLVIRKGKTLTTITQGWRSCAIFGNPDRPWLRIGWLMHTTDGDGWRVWPVFEIRPGPV